MIAGTKFCALGPIHRKLISNIIINTLSTIIELHADNKNLKLVYHAWGHQSLCHHDTKGSDVPKVHLFMTLPMAAGGMS